MLSCRSPFPLRFSVTTLLRVVPLSLHLQVIEGVDFKAIGSAELVQDAKVLLNMFTPGSPIMLEVKVSLPLRTPYSTWSCETASYAANRP